MRRRRLLALLAAYAAAPRAAARDAALQGLTEGPEAVLGVAMIARDRRGRIAFAAAHGRGVSGEGATRRERPLTLDTPARVASISKLVAMVGFMRLVGQGRLSLEADVSDVLGWRLRHPAHPDAVITAARLASHTAGLRNGRDYPVPAGRRLQDALTPGAPHYDGGSWFAPAPTRPSDFAYADVNFAVLAQLMERATGERFDRLMTRRLFAPLGLDCGYNWSGVSQRTRDLASACCRRVEGAWTPEVDALVPAAPGVRVYPPPERPDVTADDVAVGENGFAFAPQGGLRASVRDLDALARAFSRAAHGDGGVIPTAAVRRMQRPAWRWARGNGDPDRGLYHAYGLGLQVPTGRTGPAGDAFFGPGSADWRGHLGDAYGLVSGLFWNLRDGRTLSWIIPGTSRPSDETSGARSSLSPWEEAVIDAGLQRAA
jgi:CubicO group peptidase (beta-lactamase class C family)